MGLLDKIIDAARPHVSALWDRNLRYDRERQVLLLSDDVALLLVRAAARARAPGVEFEVATSGDGISIVLKKGVLAGSARVVPRSVTFDGKTVDILAETPDGFSLGFSSRILAWFADLFGVTRRLRDRLRTRLPRGVEYDGSRLLAKIAIAEVPVLRVRELGKVVHVRVQRDEAGFALACDDPGALPALADALREALGRELRDGAASLLSGLLGAER